jgi:hypothetical protein
MSPPFIAIATLGIKEGRLEDFTRSYQGGSGNREGT